MREKEISGLVFQILRWFHVIYCHLQYTTLVTGKYTVEGVYNGTERNVVVCVLSGNSLGLFVPHGNIGFGRSIHAFLKRRGPDCLCDPSPTEFLTGPLDLR